MAACDLCRCNCKAHQLEQLLTSYQIDGVVDVCPTCVKWANEQKDLLLLAIGPQMRQLIKHRHGAPPPRSLWGHLRWRLTAKPKGE